MTRDQAKKQCEIELTEDAHDEWIDDAIAAAHEWIEQYLQATLTPSRWVARYDAWPTEPYPYRLFLPMGPLLAVVSVSYLDADGDRVTLDGSGFETLRGAGGYIVPAYGTVWPQARQIDGSVAVEYEAGYEGAGSPTDASGIPRPIVMAGKMLVAHWFENREACAVGQVPQEIELGMRDALQPYRNYP